MWELASELKQAFPSYLEKDILFILDQFVANTASEYEVWTFDVIVNNENIKIPSRHFLNKIHPSRHLESFEISDIQEGIIDCFYTRHCSGYIRQYHLKKIISLNYEWVVPYVITLVGEYVIEILEIIYQNIHLLCMPLYKKFLQENPKFYTLIQARVMSYWNCYHWSYSKKDYVGFKLLDTLK